MRRFALLAVLPLSVAVGGALAPSAGAATKSSIPSWATGVTRTACSTSLTDASARAASFTVTARRIPGSTSYGFTAVLQQREANGGWQSLTGSASPAGLGTFQSAASGAARMVRKLNVEGLWLGGTYRLRVSYRWSTSTGTRSVVKGSRPCTVVDLRPNLAVSAGTAWIPAPTGGRVVYRVPLDAKRATSLLNTDVGIVVRQGTTVLATGKFRPRGGANVVLFAGQRCVAGEPVTVEVDPAGVAAESNEQDNAATGPCRSAAARR